MDTNGIKELFSRRGVHPAVEERLPFVVVHYESERGKTKSPHVADCNTALTDCAHPFKVLVNRETELSVDKDTNQRVIKRVWWKIQVYIDTQYSSVDMWTGIADGWLFEPSEEALAAL